MRRGMGFARRPGSSLDLLSNLILSLDLEEASGNAIDSSGNGYDFTDINTVGQTTGQTAGYNSRQFVTANGERFTRADSTTELTIGNNEWAAHVWAYRVSGASTGIFCKSSNTDPGTSTFRSWYFGSDSTADVARFAVGLDPAASGAVTVTTPSGEFPATTWVPILIWHDPLDDVIGIKVGANSAVTAAISTGVRNATSDVFVGSRGAAGYFNGNIAALRVWRGSGVIAQIVDNTDAIDFLNTQQRRHSELT